MGIVNKIWDWIKRLFDLGKPSLKRGHSRAMIVRVGRSYKRGRILGVR
jgi:hypothetical protein